MDARGFGALPGRTNARVSRFRFSDAAWMAGAVVLGATAVAVSVVLGTWRPLV
jgi:energy-coupling factor transport system permease protein